MISKSYKYLIVLILLNIIFLPIKSEEKIDIWENKKTNNQNSEKKIENNQDNENKIFLNINKINEKEITIEDGLINKSQEAKVFGIYEPSKYDFNLNMWSSTQADDVRASIKRLKKIKLSKTSSEIFENVLLSFSYPPNGMQEDEFIDIKLNWIIDNQRLDLLENFLNQNEDFKGKSRAVQYLVDFNISNAEIKEGCEKIKFIDSKIKDAYLEKFKIYCLVFNNQQSQAQLLLDLLREQKQSDKFFDDKIDYLLGISDKTSQKISDKNLLNFYLSSITIKDFKYIPTDKTKKQIWKYLNSANLIELDDINDKKKLQELEQAANKGQIDPKIIFNIYKQIPFNLNTLLNAKNIYQTLSKSDSRALIYQKFLLAEEYSSKVEYLFLLEEIFKKDGLQNIYSDFHIYNLKEIGLENIPENYKEIADAKIKQTETIKLGKVKYNDKILHQSKVMKFYLENENFKKSQKEIDKTFKKISKNKKYFYSAKDLALTNSLIKDGFKIPSVFNYQELSKKYEVPKNLLSLIKKKENAFLALKIVEIIGEDEPYQLDPETIFFITSLLNETSLFKIRNKILISALPQRV